MTVVGVRPLHVVRGIDAITDGAVPVGVRGPRGVIAAQRNDRVPDELLGAVLGEAGMNARSAVCVAELPLGAPVEIELIVEVS